MELPPYEFDNSWFSSHWRYDLTQTHQENTVIFYGVLPVKLARAYFH
jgi:hypothetical protein